MRTLFWFGFVSDLQPKVLFGNAFNARHVRAINPKVGLVRLVNSRPVPILGTSNDSIASIRVPQPPKSILRLDGILNDNNQDIRVYRSRTMPPNSQCFVTVTIKARGLISVNPRPELLDWYWKTTANGSAGENKSTLFCIPVENFSNQLVYVKKTHVHRSCVSGTRLHLRIKLTEMQNGCQS